MSKVCGVFVDVCSSPGKVSEEEIDGDNIQTIYDLLGCSIFDITTRMIGGKEFNIVCDDEGLLKDDPRVSAVDKNENTMLVGNLFVCNSCGSDLTSLSKDDTLHVVHNIAVCAQQNKDGGFNVHPVLFDVEYCM